MGLLHVPRVAAACARGFYKRKTAGARPRPSANATDAAAATVSATSPLTDPIIPVGICPESPHVYHARVGLFDIDGLGHMNNASYLVHAELARWQMSAENGSLDNMYHQGIAFLATGLAVRYRREIGPLFKRFQINTFVSGFDERNLWLYHTFHYHQKDMPKQQGPPLAQILLQSVVTQDRKVMDPRKYMRDVYGADEEVIDRLSKMHEDELLIEKRVKFGDLEQTLKESAGRHS